MVSPSLSLTSQVGGKYHASDRSIFTVKSRLEDSGVSVSHPLLDYIHSSTGDLNLAFDPAEHRFVDVEIDYYRAIASNSFHTVANSYSGIVGYIGGSASLEVAYAMLHSKPILAAHPLIFQPTVNPAIRELIETRRSQLRYVPDLLDSWSREPVPLPVNSEDLFWDYRLNRLEKDVVLELVDGMFTQLASAKQ